MTMEWFEHKINRLSEINDEDEKKEIVDELTIKLRSLTSLELENVATNLDFGRIFAELTSTNNDYIESVCKTLAILFEKLESGEVHNRYPIEVLKNLQHKQPAVRCLILEEIERTAQEKEKLLRLLDDLNLLIRLIDTIADENVKVATLAMGIVKKIGRLPQGCRMIYTGSLLRALARQLSKNDAVSFRVYEVVVDVARSSKEGLEASSNTGFLTSLMRVLDEDDVLVQLNALESLTDLAISADGLNYLEERGLLSKLSDQIAKANENPLSSLLIPGLMKFFGNVARCRPNEIFAKYPVVISALFQVLEGDDPVLLGNALDTLGHIGSTVEGKYALESLGDAMPRAMKRIGEIIQKSEGQVRLRGLENLVLIFHVNKDKQDNRISSLMKNWFDLLDNEPMDFIVNLCKQPFADIRQASLQVLAELASQTWGQEYIGFQPGLIEFLLDRKCETFKICKEIKYGIVKTLADASLDIFDRPTLQKFQEFLRQGPYHVDAEADVATEGAT